MLGKVTKFEENWLKNKNVTGKKQIGGWKRPPMLIGLMRQCPFETQRMSSEMPGSWQSRSLAWNSGSMDTNGSAEESSA